VTMWASLAIIIIHVEPNEGAPEKAGVGNSLSHPPRPAVLVPPGCGVVDEQP